MKAYKLSFTTYDQEGEWDSTYLTEHSIIEAYNATKLKYESDKSFGEYGDKSFGVDGCLCEWYEIEIDGDLPKPLVYLASPYTHKDEKIVEERFQKVAKKAAELMSQGLTIFSPIAMCHPMSVYGKIPGDWDFWKKFDTDYISCCNKLIVYKLDGWETSKGVQAEIKIAQEMGIPVEYID